MTGSVALNARLAALTSVGAAAQKETTRRFRHYQQLATLTDAPKAADLVAAKAPEGAAAPQKG